MRSKTRSGLAHGVRWARACRGRARSSAFRRIGKCTGYGLPAAPRLAPLRDEGVLVAASGGIFHNLRLFDVRDTTPLLWTSRFRNRLNARILKGALSALADWPALGDDAALSIPTPEHYLPRLYAVAMARDGNALEFFNDDVIGSLSMTSLIIGTA